MTYEEHIKSLVGTTVKTRDGRDARIVDVDFKAHDGEVIIARCEREILTFTLDGSWDIGRKNNTNDLILPPMPRVRRVHKIWIFGNGQLAFASIFANPGAQHDFEITVERNPDTGKWEQVK